MQRDGKWGSGLRDPAICNGALSTLIIVDLEVSTPSRQDCTISSVMPGVKPKSSASIMK
jgi:hypothetical protein